MLLRKYAKLNIDSSVSISIIVDFDDGDEIEIGLELEGLQIFWCQDDHGWQVFFYFDILNEFLFASYCVTF